MSAHTAGPWAVHHEGPWQASIWAGDAYKVHIADVSVSEKDKGEYRDNARLIAAAPELLQSLIDVCSGNDEVGHPQWKGSPDEIAARAAIAKATQP